ncbi:hypothetical protein COOONC_01553 [Cooperia oncophora]
MLCPAKALSVDQFQFRYHRCCCRDSSKNRTRKCTSAIRCWGIDSESLGSRSQGEKSPSGKEIVVDSKLELNRGRRYGLIGLNGSGKSIVMHAIVDRELPIPETVDMYLIVPEMVKASKCH